MFANSLTRKNQNRPASLTRDVIATVCTVGLTLFFVGVLVAQLSVQSDPKVFKITLGAIAILLALYAVVRIRSRLSLADRVEKQLAKFSAAENPQEIVHPIVGNNAAAAGWNNLIESVDREKDTEAIERRVASGGSGLASERLARAFRSLPEGLCVTDHTGEISFTNVAWDSTVTRLDDEHANIADVLSASRYSNWEELRNRVLTGTRPAKWELMKGRTIHDGVWRLERTPLNGREGEQPGFVWTLKDVTQSALARDSHEQFLASATHELRTPLTNITAYSESLIEMDTISPDQQKEFFNVIHSEAERLSRLLNELLDIQQLEAGSMTITVSKFDVHRMSGELKDHFEPLIREKNVNFVSSIAPDIRTIEADKEKIISCMVNLLGNAIKYTPEGGEVRFIAEQLESSVVLSVEDTGIGIAESELPKVFDRFYRCSDERVAKLEGNGLGLAFAVEVARLHNGEITVESELNKGSRFALRLPLAVEHQ